MTIQTESAWIEEAMRLADLASVAAMYEAMSAITSVATEASYAHAMALLRAHLATRPAAPEGWVLVPKEPTPEMLGASDCSIHLYEQNGNSRSCYRAMIAAATGSTK